MTMTYQIFAATTATLQSEADAASKALQTFPRGPMGLTPDSVKFSPEFRAAKAAYDRAEAALRAFNGKHAKSFAKEIRAAVTARREARLAAQQAGQS